MTQNYDVFNSIKENLLNLDPIFWVEKYIILDGKPLRLHGNGYKPFADICRYLGIKALEKNSLPCVLVKARQVGGSTLSAILELYFLSSGLFGNSTRPPMRIMHAFPYLELAYSYTKTKFNTLMNSAVQVSVPGKKSKSCVEAKLDVTASANNSLQFKQFEGGNHLFIESIGETGSRTMGKTIDCLLVDEFQRCKSAGVGNTLKTLSQSHYGPPGDGIRFFFGTPLQKGSEYHKIWLSSNQQYYFLGCEKCNDYFPLYTPESNEWESIWIDDDLPDNDPRHGFIVKCTKCGHEQDKREAAERGKWVALNQNPNIKFIGYHLNQLYIPNFPRWKVINEKPENSPINTERTYQNEVLGEFFSGDSGILTADEIEKLCGDQDRGMRQSISFSENKKVYLGMDWGLKIDADALAGLENKKSSQGQSYSCGVVIVPEGPHILNIEFATRLKRNDFESKKATVEQIFRQYSVNLGAGDIGYAGDLSEVLQREYGDQFLACQSVSKVNGHFKFKDDFFPKQIVWEKDYFIAEFYDMLKRGKVRFPFKNWEQIIWLAVHCSNMEIKASFTRGGDVNTRFVKSGINDGMSALLHALLAYRFDITKGFSDKGSTLITDGGGKKGPIPAVVGYLPGMRR